MSYTSTDPTTDVRTAAALLTIMHDDLRAAQGATLHTPTQSDNEENRTLVESVSADLMKCAAAVAVYWSTDRAAWAVWVLELIGRALADCDSLLVTDTPTPSRLLIGSINCALHAMPVWAFES